MLYSVVIKCTYYEEKNIHTTQQRTEHRSRREAPQKKKIHRQNQILYWFLLSNVQAVSKSLHKWAIVHGSNRKIRNIRRRMKEKKTTTKMTSYYFWCICGWKSNANYYTFPSKREWDRKNKTLQQKKTPQKRVHTKLSVLWIVNKSREKKYSQKWRWQVYKFKRCLLISHIFCY